MIFSESVNSEGVQLRWVQTGGDGPTRVCLHGLGAMSAPYYGAVITEQAFRGSAYAMVDLLGHGLSDAAKSHRVDDHAEAVAVLINSIGGPVDLIGHSMGGAVAILLAYRHPELVRRLVVVDPNLDPASPKHGAAGSQGIAAWSEAGFLTVPADELEALVGAQWWATMKLADRRALHQTAVDLITERPVSFREMIAESTVPRTLLFPEGDPPAGVAELRAAGVEMVPIPESGHNIMIDNPRAFAEVVAARLGFV